MPNSIWHFAMLHYFRDTFASMQNILIVLMTWFTPLVETIHFLKNWWSKTIRRYLYCVCAKKATTWLGESCLFNVNKKIKRWSLLVNVRTLQTPCHFGIVVSTRNLLTHKNNETSNVYRSDNNLARVLGQR